MFLFAVLPGSGREHEPAGGSKGDSDHEDDLESQLERVSLPSSLSADSDDLFGFGSHKAKKKTRKAIRSL